MSKHKVVDQYKPQDDTYKYLEKDVVDGKAGFFSYLHHEQEVSKGKFENNDKSEEENFLDYSELIGVFDIETNGTDILIGHLTSRGYRVEQSLDQLINNANRYEYFYADYDVPVMGLRWGKYVGKSGKKVMKYYVTENYTIEKLKNTYKVMEVPVKMMNLMLFYQTTLYKAYTSNLETIKEVVDVLKEACQKFSYKTHYKVCEGGLVDKLLFDEQTLKEWKEDKGKRADFENVDVFSDDIIKYNMLDVLATYALVLALPALYGWDVVGRTPSTFSANRIIGRANYSMPQIPESPLSPLIMQTLYRGGLFDTIKLGVFDNVIKYDVNSMYPFFTSMLPEIKKITVTEYNDPVYLTEIKNEDLYLKDAIINEDCKRIEIYYGYFKSKKPKWTSKIGTMSVRLKETPLQSIYDFEARAESAKGWVKAKISMEIDGFKHPFNFIKDMYNERLALKKAKDPREKAIKLQMNSFYGKFVERLGESTQFRNIIYGSMITAMGRMYIQKFQGITYLTDSYISNRELSNEFVGDELGQFKEEGRGKLYIIGNGMYFLDDPEEPLSKLRGYGVKEFDGYSRDDIQKAIVTYLAENLKKGEIKMLEIEEDQMLKSESMYGRVRNENEIPKIGLLDTVHKLLLPMNAKRMYEFKGNYWDSHYVLNENNLKKNMRKINEMKKTLKPIDYKEVVKEVLKK